jgi:type I restriction enzyme M protein
MFNSRPTNRSQQLQEDESLDGTANLPASDVIALEIIEDLEAALQQFSTIAADLKK